MESTVTFEVDGSRVVGTLRRAAGGPAPVVLLLPGFAGTRDEMLIASTGVGIFAHVARRLAESGLSSLRLDYRGSGESSGRFRDTTYSRQIADCRAAMTYLAASDAVDGRIIFLLGWSQGGLVAAGAAAQTPAPTAIALWAAVGEPAVAFPALIGRESYAAGLTSAGETEVTLPWGAELTLGHAFFAEAATRDPFRDVARFHGPLFLAEGTRDAAIQPGTAAKFAAAHPGSHEVWTAPMDHTFDTGAGTAMLDRLVDATVTFFIRHRADDFIALDI